MSTMFFFIISSFFWFKTNKVYILNAVSMGKIEYQIWDKGDFSL